MFFRYIFSSVGSKQIIGVAGLGLALFVLVHMLGNLLIFQGARAYNEYSHFLTQNNFILFFEAGLVSIFFIHIVLAVRLHLKNKEARGSVGYEKAPEGQKRTSWTSKTLVHQGAVIFIFIALHIRTFKFGPEYEVFYEGQRMRDIFRLVTEVFQDPLYVYGYTACLLILGFHLAHGISSALRTFGFYTQKLAPPINWVGWIYSAVVTIGFIAQPIYIHYFYRG